jgi:hypothetical protein
VEPTLCDGVVCGYAFEIGRARCIVGTGDCTDCDSFCSTVNARFGLGEAGGGECGPNLICYAQQVAPVGSWA